jgi:hypothetical protein
MKHTTTTTTTTNTNTNPLTNLYQLDNSDCCSSTSHYNHLSKYEKDILSILSKQKIKFHHKNSLDATAESRLVTIDTAVNTDISMSNAVFTIRYDDDDEEEQQQQQQQHDSVNNPKKISV